MTNPNAPSESDVQELLAEHWNKNPILVPNCKALFPSGESDLIALTKSDFSHEIEIKRNRRDFLNDFKMKTFKHRILKSFHQEKHPKYESKDVPNYFWFAFASPSLYEKCKEDLPEYAGALWVDENRVVEERSAPRLHSRSASDRLKRYLQRGLTIRYWKPRLSRFS